MKQVNEILVAIDRSAMAEEALKRAISIAKKKDAQLIVLHVIETSFIELPFTVSIDEDKIKKDFIALIEKLNKKANVEYVLFVENGKVATVVAHKVKHTNADLLIVGSHGKDDIVSSYFGSTTLTLIQNTHIPVLVVKNEVRDIYQKMILPTNLSDYSSKSILFANALFTQPSRKYLYAFQNISELQAIAYRINSEELDAARRKLASSAKIELEKFVKEAGEGELALVDLSSSINEDLLAYIVEDKADLLVLGSKGVGKLNSFVFGSTASYLVQKSPIDILVYVPVITDLKSKEKEVKPNISTIEQDLNSRKDEIRDDFESLFKENLKFSNWNIPEAENQEISEGLVSILEEKLREIKQKVKEGKYQEK